MSSVDSREGVVWPTVSAIGEASKKKQALEHHDIPETEAGTAASRRSSTHTRLSHAHDLGDRKAEHLSLRHVVAWLEMVCGSYDRSRNVARPWMAYAWSGAGETVVDQSLTSEEISAIAEEAYVYAFPIMMGYRVAYATFLQPDSPIYQGLPNAGLNGKAIPLDHTYKDVVTANADTPYSFGMLDLRAGPLVLTVPAVTDRYYVIQFENLFGHNEYFVGSRATGSAAGSHLLVGPDWEGDLPDGFATTFRFETNQVNIIGRSQLLGPDDQEPLAKIMEQYRLEPLEVYLGGEAPALEPFDWPAWDDEASRDERFITYLNKLLEVSGPVHADEVSLFERFARAGIGRGMAVDLDAMDSATREAIAKGAATGRAKIGEYAKSMGADVNGWRVTDLGGNRAFYGVDYMKRAAVALIGYGANDRIEADYPMVRIDGDGNPLDGNAKYQLTLATKPPVNAFWSVTMYDTSYDGTAGFMVENPIDRYLINSTTQGLDEDESGGLTITMQRDEPTDAAERANWLPTPNGGFYLALRMYWPKPEALNGEWSPPPVVRVK